jgi:hypothetical protein
MKIIKDRHETYFFTELTGTFHFPLLLRFAVGTTRARKRKFCELKLSTKRWNSAIIKR